MHSDQWIGLAIAIPSYIVLRYILRRAVAKWRKRGEQG